MLRSHQMGQSKAIGSNAALVPGVLVKLPGDRGVGKVVSTDGENYTLSVFYSIVRSTNIQLPSAQVRRAYLSPQTRVYVRLADRYRIGRIVNYMLQDGGVVEYEVRFPNGKQADVSERDLYVRPWAAPEDPANVLAAGGAESQYLFDRREAATSALLQLRSASQGLTALVSAGVELVPHQIAAVRRILADPVQRYLLADEVGLGKTIEAGLVIRQHLIDNPRTRVLVAAPNHLLAQWDSELNSKLRLDQFDDAFKICTHGDLANIEAAPDLLVVDEVHHLVGIDAGPLQSSAVRLTELAKESSTLLLLSATPVLGDERRFLALLNLLDSDSHPLADTEGFHVKFESRREYGRLLLSLDPEAPGIVLRQRGAEAMRLFPNDRTVLDLAPRLIEASKSGDGKVRDLCTALRQHIAESYRIHQRLIRSRRADARGWEFRSRGPAVSAPPILTHLREEVDGDPRTDDCINGLEDWRIAALVALTEDDRLDSITIARRYCDLLEALGVDFETFDRELKRMPALFTGEKDILSDLSEVVASSEDRYLRIETMVESTMRLRKSLAVSNSHPRIVVFSSSTGVAKAFHQLLSARLEDFDSLILTTETDPDTAKAIMAVFVSSNSSGILVVDRCGEEGLNLSCADAIVHLDLPFSAARLEQRIGRLDRFGRKQDIIRHRILLPSDDETTPWAAWQKLLAEGFLIYNESISDVQFLLETIEAEVLSALLEEGAKGLDRMIPVIRARITEERRSQDEQTALDRIALAEEPVDALIDAIDFAEEREDQLEASADRWLVDALHLKKRPFAWPATDPFRLIPTPQTLIPKIPWLEQFEICDGLPLTWRRRIAASHPDATLLRPGTPLVDAAERFTRWDDRGTAFATWRTDADWGSEPWIGFRLCFVIEPNVGSADPIFPTAEERALLRRAQQYLPLGYEVLHVDVDANAVEDPTLLSILKRPYDSDTGGGRRADRNLGSRPRLLFSVIDETSFSRACLGVRDKARSAIVDGDALRTRISLATNRAKEDLRRRKQRYAQRLIDGDAGAQTDLLTAEKIVESVASPAVRLDSIGCFVVANSLPALSADA